MGDDAATVEQLRAELRRARDEIDAVQRREAALTATVSAVIFGRPATMRLRASRTGIMQRRNRRICRPICAAA